MSQAVHVLRSTGSPLLASRLSRLTKCCNGAAHPDMSFIGDLTQHIEAVRSDSHEHESSREGRSKDGGPQKGDIKLKSGDAKDGSIGNDPCS